MFIFISHTSLCWIQQSIYLMHLFSKWQTKYWCLYAHYTYRARHIFCFISFSYISQ